MPMPTIAVIGAGFSGTLLSLHILRRCPPGTRVILVERNSQFGRGQAYSTGNPSHLLNVPAGRMSAFHDSPHHFLEWLQAQPATPAPTAGTFVPRQQFGAYIRTLLHDQVKARGESLELLHGDISSISADGTYFTLRDTTNGRDKTIEADLVVLAVGNFPPEPFPVADTSFYDSPFYCANPWSPDNFDDLDPEASVLTIGTGLTTIDVVISLLDQGHAGPIHAISRRGLLPRRHCPAHGPAAAQHWSLPPSVALLTHLVRGEVKNLVAAGGTWQAAIDALRPYTQDFWQALPHAERTRFLRHLRPWWDVHRHRIAPAVADRIEAAQASGQFTVQAGRIAGFDCADDGVTVRYRPRRSPTMQTLKVARVINCSGPGADYDRIDHPLVRNLLRDGLVRPDALRLGLDVTTNCAVIDAKGRIARNLFAIGPVTKGAFWEMTAVPDLRRQCEQLANHLATLVRTVPARIPVANSVDATDARLHAPIHVASQYAPE